MNSDSSSKKTCVIDVSTREVAFFKKEYPLHHAVLLELVKRGEARILPDTAGG